MAQATLLVVDDDGAFSLPFVADDNLLATQVDRCFVAVTLEAERVVLLDRASGLGVEQFVRVLRRREEPNARQVHPEAIDRLHAQRRVDRGVVILLDPMVELAVEFLKRREIELANEELIAEKKRGRGSEKKRGRGSFFGVVRLQYQTVFGGVVQRSSSCATTKTRG